MAFKKGHSPWNKGVKYNEELKNRLNTDGLSKGRGITRGKIIKETYPNIHYWVRKHKDYPNFCASCERSGVRLEWSNVDHRYRLELDDYVALCRKCHVRYDFDSGLVDKKKRYATYRKGGVI